MGESELARQVVEWLIAQHWDVYQEVQVRAYGHIADIVAVRCGLVWVIECKQSLTFKVLEQASLWRVHFRSVAVARAQQSDRAFAVRVARDYLNLGVIQGSRLGVYEIASPPLMRHYHGAAKYLAGHLSAEHKTHAQAGSNRGGQFTPYRRTMDLVRNFIGRYPGCTLKEIMDDVKSEHHYCTNSVARSAIRTALETWEKNWCLIDRSDGRLRYYLRERTSVA